MSIMSLGDDLAKISFKALEPNGGIAGSWGMRLEDGATSAFIKTRDELEAGVQATSARPGQPIGLFPESGGFSVKPLAAHRNGFSMYGPETPPLGPNLMFEYGHLDSIKGSNIAAVTSKLPDGQLGRVFEADVMSNSEMYNRGLTGARRP